MMKISEIQKTALNKLKGKWSNALGITALFTLVNLALSYALTAIQNITVNAPILYFFSKIIYLAVFLILSFGLVSSLHKLSNNQKVGMTSFINEAFLNASKTISIFLRVLMKILIPSILLILGTVAIMALLINLIQPLVENSISASLFISLILVTLFGLFISICSLVISAPYGLSFYILADNKDMFAKDIVEQSALLTKNNKWKFIKLIICFTLCLAIINIITNLLAPQVIVNYVQWFCMIFLMPYMATSISVFYEETLNTSNTIIDNNQSDNSDSIN